MPDTRRNIPREQLRADMDVLVRKRPSEINGKVYKTKPWHAIIARQSGTNRGPRIVRNKAGREIGVSVYRRSTGAEHLALWEELFTLDATVERARAQTVRSANPDGARGHGQVDVDGEIYASLNAAAHALYPTLGKRGTQAWLRHFSQHGHKVIFAR